MNARRKFSLAVLNEEIEAKYGLTPHQETEQYNAVINNRTEYEMGLVNDLLDALRKEGCKNSFSVSLGSFPDWPTERIDSAIIQIKEGFLLQLKKKHLVQDYKTVQESEYITDRDGTSGSTYEYLAAIVSVHNIRQLTAFLQQIKKERDETQKIVYRINYDLQDRKIILNGKYVLSRQDYGSENFDFFWYLYRRSGVPIRISRIAEYRKEPFKKRIHSILSDLGFRGELLQLFFPNASSSGVMFRNPITREEFRNIKIDKKALKKQVISLSKIE